MRIRVLNGTPRHDVSLCDTCSNLRRRRGVRFADTWYGCEEFSGPIRQPVVDCTNYHDARLHAPAEMSKQAFRWVPSLGQFLSPVDWDRARANNKLKGGDF